MLLLVSGDELRQRLGLPNLDTVQAAADAAAQAAVHELETDIRTPLSAAQYTDTFALEVADQLLPRIKFKLSAGFVSGSLTVGTGCTPADAIADNSGQLDDSIIHDLERGTFVLIVNCWVNRFISVRYAAGFDEDSNNQGFFDVPQPQQWLKEAAMLKGIALLSDAPDLESKSNGIVDGKAYQRQYASLITPRIRYSPLSRLPIV